MEAAQCPRENPTEALDTATVSEETMLVARQRVLLTVRETRRARYVAWRSLLGGLNFNFT